MKNQRFKTLSTNNFQHFILKPIREEEVITKRERKDDTKGGVGKTLKKKSVLRCR